MAPEELEERAQNLEDHGTIPAFELDVLSAIDGMEL
jgi:hypothetical protein